MTYYVPRMALADAQTLAIRKLLSKAAFESTISPGPPLPKSHPSPSLAAKLHLDCASLYSSARSLAKTPGASRPSLTSVASSTKSKFKLNIGKKDKDKEGTAEGNVPRGDAGEDVSPELRRYLADEVAFHNALAHKWLGVDAGENGTTAEGGRAVGFLAWAKKELEVLKSGGLGHGIGISDRERIMRETRRARVQIELESVNTFLKGYKRMNDSVTVSCLLWHIIPIDQDFVARISTCPATV